MKRRKRQKTAYIGSSFAFINEEGYTEDSSYVNQLFPTFAPNSSSYITHFCSRLDELKEGKTRIAYKKRWRRKATVTGPITTMGLYPNESAEADKVYIMVAGDKTLYLVDRPR